MIKRMHARSGISWRTHTVNKRTPHSTAATFSLPRSVVSTVGNWRTCVELAGMDNREGTQDYAQKTEQLPFGVAPLDSLKRVHGTCSSVANGKASAARARTRALGRFCCVLLDA